jgi:glycosyltransferase involved in cell wall biosynthesis
MSSSSNAPDPDLARGDPDVSVIIPAYNTGPYIADAVASVLAQTYTSHEVIVVNDGSPDTELLERELAPFRDRIVYLKQENAGLSSARNAGIRIARGRYVALLDSDDEWEPDYLASQVAVLDADPSLAAVYPDALIVGDHPHAGRTYQEVCPSPREPTFHRVLTQECHVFVGLLARRDALLRAGLFDPELRSVEDFDLWLRLLASGERMVCNRRVLVKFRKRRDSLSADPVWMAEHVLRVLDKAARTLTLSPAEMLALDERRVYFRAQLELARGKRAFFRHDVDSAVSHIGKGNTFFRSWKLRLVCALIRTAPGVLIRAYRLRDRLLFGADTSF